MSRKTNKAKRPKVKSGTKGGELCIKCPSLCCKDFVMMVTKPKDESDMEELKTYLFYDTSSVFINNHRWYVRFKGTCIYLDANSLCTIYSKRPARCRRHMPPNCEKFGQWYDVMINTPEELEEYLNK